MDKPNDKALAISGQNKFFYGWLIVIAATAIYAVAAGQAVSFGIFVKPMAGDFGWSRASLTGAFTLFLVAMTVFSFICGILVDRIGPRILNIAGGITMALGFYLSSKLSAPWHFYLSYSLLGGLGFSCMFVALPSTISRWFNDKEGLALGIFYAGGGLGGLLLSPLLQFLIDRYSWRAAFGILAALVCCVIVPAALFLRKQPQDIGMLPLGTNRETPEKNVESSGDENQTPAVRGPVRDYTLMGALKSAPFWIFGAAMNLLFIGVMMAQINMVPHATDRGVTAATAALALGIAAAFNSLGRLVIGAVSDKIGVKSSLYICFVIGACSLLWLLAVNKPWMMFLFVAPFGFAYGGSVPLMPRVISELFGVKYMGSIFGLFTSITCIGPALGPFLGGAIHDRTGSYTLAFLIGTASILIGLLLVTPLRLTKR